MISRIIKGENRFYAWTKDDESLIDGLSKMEQEKVFTWINKNLFPTKHTPLMTLSSYGLKHCLEEDLKIYLTNNQFKDAMLKLDWFPADMHMLNWHFNISKSSPLFTRRKKKGLSKIIDEYKAESEDKECSET